MNYHTRKSLYRRIETLRGHPLIVYATSMRPGVTGMVAPDAIPQIIDQVNLLPEATEEIDLLIESGGGDALTSWRLISILRSKIKTIHVLIPSEAFSAATILALGADSIVLGNHGCLGPIDPQLTIKNKDGSQDKFSYEELLAFLEFVTTDIGLSEQEYKLEALKMLGLMTKPSSIGFAKRASSLSIEIGEKLLLTHMNAGQKDKTKARNIATKLNKSFFDHGHALYKKEAKNIGLNIKDAGNIENLMWRIHLSIEAESCARIPFDPLAEFFSDPTSIGYLANPPVITIPPGANQQTADQLVARYLMQQLSAQTPDVRRIIKMVFVESVRGAQQLQNVVKIIVSRNLDLSYNMNVPTLSTKWEEQE